MKVSDTPLVGLKLIVPDAFPDNRGYFVETYHATKYALEGLDESFVQDNLSHSKKNVLRGLHYQYPGAQGKLIYVTQGEIFDVAVDIRKDSPTLGKWYAVTLSAQNHRQLYISPGFAHGFCVLSDTAEVIYKCTDFYNPAYEHTLLWNDPTLAITWPVAQPIISEKDAGGKRWQEAMLLG